MRLFTGLLVFTGRGWIRRAVLLVLLGSLVPMGRIGPIGRTGPIDRGAEAAALAPAQSHSVDAALVFESAENGGSVHYALYGHSPAIPQPVTTPLTWNWWTVGAGDTTVTGTPAAPVESSLGTAIRPDIAFSREGTALAVWGGTKLQATPFTCDSDGGGPNPPQMLPRYHGSIRYSQLTRQADGDAVWSAPATLAETPNGGNVDHIYSNPSIAVDSTGTAIVIWVHTRLTYTTLCPIAAEYQILTRRWNGTAWGSEAAVAPNPADATAFEPARCSPSPFATPFICEVFTDMTFLSELAPAGSPTRQTALAVWNAFVGTASSGCGPQQQFWPRSAKWSGTAFGAPSDIPGRKTYALYRGEKLGISATSAGQARLVFPTFRDSDPCVGGNESEESWYANWDGATWLTTAKLADGKSPDLLVLPDDTAIGAFVSSGIKWAAGNLAGGWVTQGALAGSAGSETPSLASLPHGRSIVAWAEAGAIRWSSRDGAGAWSASVSLGAVTGAGSPELAASTSSPSLPHAQWTILDYDAGDTYPAGAGQQHNHLLTRYESVGPSALANVISLYDDPGSPNNTRIFLHKPGTRTQLTDLGAANVGQAQMLRDFLAAAHERLPARQRILKFSDHGVGWGGLCLDNNPTNGERLTLPELRQALIGALGAPPLTSDVPYAAILFHPCQMGMVEVAYQIREFGKFLAASGENTPIHTATTLPNAGFREDLLLQHLIDQPAIQLNDSSAGSNRGLMQRIVDDYGANNQVNNRDYQYAAIDLAQIGPLVTDIQAWAAAMHSAITDGLLVTRAFNKFALQLDLRAAQAMRGDSSHRDLFHLASLIQADAGLPQEVRDAAATVANRRAATVVAEWHDPGPPAGVGISKAKTTGLTIWAPTSGGVYSGGRGNPTSTAYDSLEFVQQFLGGKPAPAATWSGFLAAVHGSVDQRVQLESGSPRLFVTVDGGSAGSIGGLNNENCGPFCLSTVPDAICDDNGRAKQIWLPGDFPRFDWIVDGSYLTDTVTTTLAINAGPVVSTSFTLTIEVIADNSVVKSLVQIGTIMAGQRMTGTFDGRLPRVYVPYATK